MIVTATNTKDGAQEALRLVTQNDHAHLSAEILRLWRADGLPDHPRRTTILRAAREHDNGWRESDAAPRIDAERGLPHDFKTLGDDDRRVLWRRGVARYLEDAPEIAVLILAHARRLHRSRADNDDWRPLLDDWRTRMGELTTALRLAPEDVEADHRFVDLADTLSLALADRWQGSFTFRDLHLEGRPGDEVDTLAVAPFPLAGATTFTLACRHIEHRRYTSDTDLTLALVEARWGERRVRLMPLERMV